VLNAYVSLVYSTSSIVVWAKQL